MVGGAFALVFGSIAAASPGEVDFSDTGVLRSTDGEPVGGFSAVTYPYDPMTDPASFFDPELESVPEPAVAPLPTAGGLGLVGIGVLAARRRRR